MGMLRLDDVFKAIMDKFNASSVLKGMVTGMYAYQAPAGVAFPYIIFTIQGDTPWDTMGTVTYGERLIVQFSVFSKAFPDVTECLNIVKELTSAYDEAELSLSQYYCLRLARQGSVMPIGHPTEGLFHAPVRYVLTVQAK